MDTSLIDHKAGYALRNHLQSAQPYEIFDVNIFLTGEPAAERLALAADQAVERVTPGEVVRDLKRRSAEDQRDLLAFLGESRGAAALVDAEISLPRVQSVASFWIANAVGAEVAYEMLERVLRRPDVLHVELARHNDIRELIDARKKVPAPTRSKAKAATRAKSAPDRAPRSRGRPQAAKGAPDAEPTWSVRRVKAPLLWQLGLTGAGIVVAIVDSGVNYTHPDLKDHMWDGGDAYPLHGYDFASDANDPMDDDPITDGHGTACAGQVAGDGTMGSTTGVAPRAAIMAIRVGGAERSFWRGLEFALEQQAHVISMSMSWKYPSSPDYPGWRRLCETILAAGVLHANSIGNQGHQLTVYPIPYNIATPGSCPPPWLHPLQTPKAGLSSAISCGATDDSDQLAFYSGRGPAAWEIGPYLDYPYQGGTKPGLIKPDLCAPGPGTTGCNWRFGLDPHAKPYRSFGGTSAATPHVGGCLALLAQACRRAGQPILPARIQEALENTAVRIAGQTRDKENHFGAGRVDVYAACRYGEQRGWWS